MICRIVAPVHASCDDHQSLRWVLVLICTTVPAQIEACGCMNCVTGELAAGRTIRDSCGYLGIIGASSVRVLFRSKVTVCPATLSLTSALRTCE